MNNKQNTKVRLVKCPRCAKLLPEPEHVPLYTCGGCGTTLQAKYYRGNHKDAALPSRERDVDRSNGVVNARNGGASHGSSRRSSSSAERSEAQDKGRDQDAIENSSTREQNAAVNSSDHTSSSKESSFVENKESEVVDNKADQLDLKDQTRGSDQDAVESGDAEKNGAANHSHRAALPEESNFVVNKENGGTDSEIEQLDSKNQVANGFPTVFEKKELVQCTGPRTATEDDSGSDEQCNGIVVEKHQEKQMGDEKYGRETYPVEDSQALENGECQKVAALRRSTEDDDDQRKQKHVTDSTSSPATMDAAECVSSAHVVSKATRKMHLVREHTHQDQHEEKQIGYLNSSTAASSLTMSSAVDNKAEREASDLEVSKEPRKIHLVGKQSHQDQHGQKQAQHVNSSFDISLLNKSSAINTLAKHDASDHGGSIQTREIHLVGKQHEREQIGYENGPVSSSIENPVKHGASDCEVSEETRKKHPVGNHLDHNQLEQSQVEYVDSAKDASSWNESPAIKNRAKYDASHQEMSEVAKMMPLAGKDNPHEQHEQSEDPAKDTSSGTKSSVIKETTKLAFGNSAYNDASDHEESKENRKMLLAGKHSHQDFLGNEIKCHSVYEAEVEKSGKESGEERGQNNVAEFVVEQRGSAKLSNETSLINEVPQDENDIASVPSSATKVSRDPHSGSISVGYDKGTSKKNVKNFGDDSVHTDAEVGSLLKEVPRYSQHRSPAYDGSVSSFDGNEDPEHPAEVVRGTLSPNNSAAGYDGAEESPEWNHTMPDRMMYKNPRVQTQARSSSSVQLDKKMKSSMVGEGRPREAYAIPERINRYRPNRDSFLPRVPNHRRSSDAAFETGSSSSYALHEELPTHQMHHYPYRRRLPEVPSWREREFLPTHYNYETSGEIFNRPNYYHAYSDRRRRAQSGTLPQMPYSGEIFNGRYPYMHRYADNRGWSAQLAPPAVCFHQGAYMGPTWETRQDQYDSYPTSPQRFVESESSCTWGHDTTSLWDDQRHRNQIMRRMYLREKRKAVKEQFHPTAGGAPFISCYFCFNILQLPKGFLVSRGRTRRAHKLQCGACSSVLEFSLENEGGLAPSEANVNRNANQAMPSSSHANHSRHSSLNSVDGRELLSRDSFDASSLERTKVAHGSSRTRERMERLHDDDEHPGRGRQAKVTWNLPARSKSPLHRLMGYSSPQDLLSAFEADDVK